MKRLQRVMVAGLVLLALAGCGDDSKPSDTSPATTVTTASSDTSSPETTPTTAGKSCLTIASEAVKLATDYRNESRGVAGPPDATAFKEKARALRDEAEAAGCQIPPAIDQFLDG